MVGGPEELHHLLLVEDSPHDARLVKEAFVDSPFDPTIHHVTDSHAAIQFLTQRGSYDDAPSPDMVLLDWNLSETTGEAVLRTARTIPMEFPVVVLTGCQAQERSIRSKAEDADACITKPSDPEEYIEAIRSV